MTDAEKSADRVDDQPSEGRILELERFLPYRLSVLSNTISKSIARLYADRFGITIPEWRIIAVLARFGPGSAADICGTTAMDKVQVSRALQRLTDAKLASRTIDKADRRRAVVDLTAKGRAVYDEIVPLALSREAVLLDGLSTAERSQLDTILTKLAIRADGLARG